MDNESTSKGAIDFTRFKETGTRRMYLGAGLIAFLLSVGYFTIALTEDISISDRERMQLIEMTNSFVSVYSDVRGDSATIPATYRRLGIDHFNDFAVSGQGGGETLVRMPGRPGFELQTMEEDQRLADIIQRYVDEPATKPLEEHRFEGNRFVGRTVFPSVATSESCVACHNAALGSDVYAVGDVMGAFIVERDLTWALVKDIRYAGILFGVSFLLFTLVALRELNRDLTVTRLESQVRIEEMKSAAEAKEKFLLSHDSLTGLPNRKLFNDHMSALFHDGRKERLAVALIDLDEFKAVNDSMGHAAGDALLTCVAARLQSCATGSGGLVARLGGDEFAMVWEVQAPVDAEIMGQTILNAMTTPLKYEQWTLMPKCSVGIALWSVAQSDSLSCLLKASDDALYTAKDRGKNTYQVFDQTLSEAAIWRDAVASQLPNDIREGRLRAVVQPKVSLDDGSFTGFEALARWRHEGKDVPPDAFIPIAEQTGTIRELDLYILEEAARFSTELEAQTGLAVPVSVNLSANSFRSGSLVEDIEDVLLCTELDPERLTLELTETAAIENWDVVEGVLSRLRERGIRAALDDFGTGYSSLGYLLRMQFEEIKIDKAFIEDIEHSDGNSVIFKHISAMTESLGTHLVIEGVETERQLEMISGGKNRIAQGYFFSPPMELDDARAYIGAIAQATEPGTVLEDRLSA